MKNIAAFFSLLSLSLISAAQAPTEKTLLWEISGNGIQQSSFIYGTIHLMCSKDLQVPKMVAQKFNTTKKLILEIDLKDPAIMQEMMTGILMKDTSTLENLLGIEAYEQLSKRFNGSIGFPLDMMKKSKPIFLMAMVYPTMLGCQPDSWEKTFVDMAEEKGMETSGLEKVSDQMKVFDKIPYKVQADMLFQLMNNLDSAKTSLQQMIDIYKSKDIQKLHELLTSDKDFGSYEAVLLSDRNKNWIPVIKKQIENEPTFIAVGAGHLGGLNGVIHLLRKSGFTVTPVLY